MAGGQEITGRLADRPTDRCATRQPICHFDQLTAADRARLFYLAPEPVEPYGDSRLLATALGATLYTPANRPDLVAVLERQRSHGVVSMVADLEDGVADGDVDAAQASLVAALSEAAHRESVALPLLFVRVRRPGQLREIAAALGPALGLLTGFVLPKFDDAVGPGYLQAIDDASAMAGRLLYAMPVLESPDIIFAERRAATLAATKRMLDTRAPAVLTVRVGATDLCGLYGLRRDRELTIYDVHLVASVIADIVNVFGRAGDGYLISAPVWEYYSDHQRLFKPQLRESPFTEAHEGSLRSQLLAADLDGLIRETVLDKANGLTGKSVIHPSHVPAVHALQVVTHEEYSDACDLLVPGSVSGGVRGSGYRNKMNEMKPHRGWAEGIHRRAQVFGVTNPGVSLVDLLAACLT